MEKALKNQRGMTIISVLVASAIGLIVMSAMMMGMSNQSRAIKTSSENIEMNYLQEEVHNMMINPAACLNTVGTMNPNVVNVVTAIKDASNVVRIDNTMIYGNENIGIEGFKFGDPTANIAASSSGTAYLNLELKRSGMSYGAQRVVKRVPVFVTTNAGGTVISCSTNGDTTSSTPTILGQYSTNTNGTCIYQNPYTFSCGCPPNYVPKITAQFDAAGFYGTKDGTLYTCFLVSSLPTPTPGPPIFPGFPKNCGGLPCP